MGSYKYVPSRRKEPERGLRFIYRIGLHSIGGIGPLLFRVSWSLRLGTGV